MVTKYQISILFKNNYLITLILEAPFFLKASPIFDEMSPVEFKSTWFPFSMQEWRKVKILGTSSNAGGVICPRGWNRVNQRENKLRESLGILSTNHEQYIFGGWR